MSVHSRLKRWYDAALASAVALSSCTGAYAYPQAESDCQAWQGLLAGAVASGSASVLAWVLARQVFDLAHRPDPWIWLIGVGGGMLLVLLAGWLATRDLLDEPPLAALRRE